MKAALLVTGAIFLILLTSGCTMEPQRCPEPYSNVSGKCCIDGNNNSVCDFEEQVPPPPGPAKNYAPYAVRMYISPYSPEPDSWSSLPPSPVRNYDGYQVFNYPQDAQYYDGGWFMLYSTYIVEPIACSVSEYHNSALSKQYVMNLTPKGAAGDVNGAITKALFPVIPGGALREVKYMVNCTASESGIEFNDVYAVGVRVP